MPAVVRPAFTLGGHGGGFVTSRGGASAPGRARASQTLPIGQVLVEESLKGWDEFELEVVRDRADNVVIVCSIENLDPMGVHTGDSVTVAPQMTLSDEAYQELRDAAVAIVRAVGVDTGGSNIQFARHRESGEVRVIEMNPRVSRSSALASKATGYPIAKVAARLAVGYTLDEIPNDLTGTTPGELRADARLRRREDAALRVREVPGRRPDARHADEVGRRVDGDRPHLRRGVRQGPARPRARLGLAARGPPSVVRRRARARRSRRARRPSAASTRAPARSRRASNYFYSTRGERDERPPAPGRSVVILGSGPNRIGQGIEFDYCCVHAAESFRAQGYEAVMVNCNPETVSTDYDTSDRLYFEPLDEEAVLAVLAREQPVGVCIQFGGQTPLKLARAIERAGYRILGTPFDAVDLAEDRERFGRLAESLGVRCPEWGIATSGEEAVAIAERVGYPVLVRPVVRARRPRDAGLLRRGRRPRRDGGGRGCGARRPLPRERGRARRRRALRRRGDLCRGGDGARRGGRDPLGRLLVRPAGAVRLGRRSARSSAGSGRRSASSAC